MQEFAGDAICDLYYGGDTEGNIVLVEQKNNVMWDI